MDANPRVCGSMHCCFAADQIARPHLAGVADGEQVERAAHLGEGQCHLMQPLVEGSSAALGARSQCAGPLRARVRCGGGGGEGVQQTKSASWATRKHRPAIAVRNSGNKNKCTMHAYMHASNTQSPTHPPVHIPVAAFPPTIEPPPQPPTTTTTTHAHTSALLRPASRQRLPAATLLAAGSAPS
jgi:hypothetical protein